MIFSNYSRYWGSFFITGLLCIILYFYSSSEAGKSKSTALSSTKFQSFQSNYLFIFLLAVFADWLQGPYVYELYVSYGFNQLQIAELFVCGFGSSMIVGTFVGGLADRLGRKSMCIVYCLCYTLGCVTKLFPNYWILMFGRFLSGIATSLLFSVFESWMVCEHHKQGYDGILIGDTFAYATFGNGLVAVTAGLVANFVAGSFGFVGPFIVAIIPLLAVANLVYLTWPENYGNEQMSLMSSLVKGFDLIRHDSRIAALGLAQSCFEGAMYTFVFMWTPALKSSVEIKAELEGKSLDDSTSSYLGLIFSVFMISSMVGSAIFKIFSTNKDVLYIIPLILHILAVLSMTTVALFIDDKDVIYFMFLLFEISVGLFYPSYGVIKSEKIPEDIRSSVMNIFRIPLNAFVVLLLLKIKELSPRSVFKICALTHAIALIAYYYFYKSTTKSSSSSVDSKYTTVPSVDDDENTV